MLKCRKCFEPVDHVDENGICQECRINSKINRLMNAKAIVSCSCIAAIFISLVALSKYSMDLLNGHVVQRAMIHINGFNIWWALLWTAILSIWIIGFMCIKKRIRKLEDQKRKLIK